VLGNFGVRGGFVAVYGNVAIKLKSWFGFYNCFALTPSPSPERSFLAGRGELCFDFYNISSKLIMMQFER